MADNDDDIDDDTLERFNRILAKAGGPWLTKQAETLKALLQAPVSSPSQNGQNGTGSGDLLQKLWEKAEKEKEVLLSRLDAMRDVLTPEQLVSLRAPKPPQSDAADPPKTEAKPEAKPKPKGRWL